MVSLVPATKRNISNQLRACGYGCITITIAIQRANSAQSLDFSEQGNNQVHRLGTCSRDPIEYEGSKWNLYEFISGMPLIGLDPSGKFFWISGCSRPTPRGDNACCGEAKRLGLDNGDVAGVVCCDGRKVSCVWITGGATGTGAGSPAKRIIDACSKEHEDEHHGQIGPCSSSVPNLNRPPFSPGVTPDQGECNAYKKELKCLQRTKPNCGMDMACHQEVQTEMDEILLRGANHCRNAGLPFP